MSNPQTQSQQITEPVDDLSPLSPEDEAALQEEVAKEAQAGETPDVKSEALPTMKQMRALLERPIPTRLLKSMKNYGGGGSITYIHWTTVKKFLDLRSPGWRYYVRQIAVTEIGVAIATELHVPCSDGTLVGSGVGFEPHRQGKDNKPTGFGGAPVVAERQALKRSAAMLGLGFSLYQG